MTRDRPTHPGQLLMSALMNPSAALEFSLPQWDGVIRIARLEGVLGTLHRVLQERGHLPSLPPRVRDYLAAGRTLAASHERMIRWESRCIARALSSVPARVMLLKGAAYLALDLDLARGRLVSDVDILVARDELLGVEAALLAAGWEHTKLDSYDQRYYRRWMHEIPPLRHPVRDTIIDLHHAILPDTSRLQPDAGLILTAGRPLPGSLFHVPQPPDLLLHCATHMFHDGELSHALRDLYDLHCLFTGLGARRGFWPRLARRAGELGLGRPLWYAAHFCRELLGTPIPDSLFDDIAADAPGRVPRALMQWMVPAVAVPDLRQRHAGKRLARRLLYIRSHWLRMPPSLLLPHLARKALRQGGRTATGTAAP